MRLEPADWALVHDRREPRHFAFWRGLDLCTAACAEQVTPGALWADVGAGTGHLAATLAALGARVIGLDFDPRMALYARRRWSRPFAAAAASALPLADGSCAGLVAVSLLGCMPEPAALCAEAARVLAPGGTLCLTAMNRRSLLLAAAKLWTRAAGQRTGRYTAHDPAALAAALRGAGFAIERQILYGHFLSGRRRILPAPATARRLERITPPGAASAWARQVLLIARRR
jgi:SAM-dependent methyltransferase